MLRNIELGREKALNIVYLKAISSVIQVKMIVLSCLFGKMRNLRHIIPFLVTLFCFAFPNTFWAQEANWPWVSDGQNFAITSNLENSFYPSIASNDQIYFVAWYQKTDSGFDIYGARITKDGKVIDEVPIPICTAADDQMFPSVAWGGENFLVVWQDRRSGTRWDVYGARVNPEANRGEGEEPVLDPDGIPIAVGKSSYDKVSPALSFDGENFLVVWRGKKSSKIWNIYFNLVSSKDGKPIYEKPIALNPSSKNQQASPAVSFNGDSYIIVWQERRSNQFWAIVGAKVFPTGELLSPEEIEISPAAGQEAVWDRWKPEITWNGRIHLILWTSQREKDGWSIEGKRLEPYFWNMDSEDLVLESGNTGKAFPAAVWDDGLQQFLLLWEDDAAGESTIYGASLQTGSKPFVESNPKQISASDANSPAIPMVSKSGDGILAIWEEIGPGGNWQIFGRRLKRRVEPPPVSEGSGSGN
jgi:dipeptidyl aminopeptidase/acylaminoacyl peptidase